MDMGISSVKSNILYTSLKLYSELIRKLIIADIDGYSIDISDLKIAMSKLITIPLISIKKSCYCPNCFEYNESKKLDRCHSCNTNLSTKMELKANITKYKSLKKNLTKYDFRRYNIIFDECHLSDISISKIDSTDKITIHISPFFIFEKEFIVCKHNLNHVFMDWSMLYRLFEKDDSSKFMAKINEYVYEEKNKSLGK